MGTFVGHLVPGLALTFLGLWHTFNSISAYYVKGRSGFTSRFWYPFTCPIFKFKHLELSLILSFSIFAITMQLLNYPIFKFSFVLDNFEHATMFLHLAIYAIVTLLIESTPSPEMFTGLIGVLSASVFGQELFLLHFHSTDHVGLEGHYHWLWQLIVLVSFVAVIGVSCVPNSFALALVLSISLVFQGCWLVSMGFMLWVPWFVPKGCMVRLVERVNDMRGAVICDSDEAFHRAQAMANLEFSWILAWILIVVSILCLTISGKGLLVKNQCVKYEQLRGKGDVSMQVQA